MTNTLSILLDCSDLPPITLDLWMFYIRIHRDITGEMWFGVG